MGRWTHLYTQLGRVRSSPGCSGNVIALLLERPNVVVSTSQGTSKEASVVTGVHQLVVKLKQHISNRFMGLPKERACAWAGSGCGAEPCWQPARQLPQQSRRCGGPSGEPGSWLSWRLQASWPTKVRAISGTFLLRRLPAKGRGIGYLPAQTLACQGQGQGL